MVAAGGNALGGGTGETRLLALLAGLYVAQGLPLGLAFEALPVLARQAGAPLDVLAFLPLLSLPWILKFLWAPLVDNWGSARFGRRKSWLVPCQIVLGLSLLALGFAPLDLDNAMPMTLLVVGATLAAATQDAATDGLAAERLRGRALAHANAIQIGGWMAGFMAGGAGYLILSEHAGPLAGFVILALVPLASAAGLCAWNEWSGSAHRQRTRASLLRTLRRPGFPLLLVLSLLYGTAQVGATSITRLLLVDAGWSPATVGWVTLAGNLAMAALGCPIGAHAVNRFGLARALVMGIAAGAGALLVWSLLAAGLVPVTLASVLAAGMLVGLASGLVGVAASTLAMDFGGKSDQPSTDVTVLQSANVLGEMMVASLTVWLAARLGYADALLAMALALVVLTVLVRTGRGRFATLLPEPSP